MDALTKSINRSNAIINTAHSKAMRLKEMGLIDRLASPGSSIDFRGQLQSRQNLNSFRSWVYSAVNAHASEAASQPVNVGKMKGKETGSEEEKKRRLRQKSFILSRMTKTIQQKAADQELEIVASHPLMDLLDHPNQIQHRYQFVYTFVANLNLTGRAYIIFDKDEKGKTVLYSLPSTWVRPDHKEGPFSKFYVGNPKNPESQMDQEPLDASQVAMAYLPNPADPLGAISPAASQMSAIRVDEKIQMVSEKFFDNGIFPSMVVTVGKDPHPDVPGGMRPRLNPAQRRQVYGAIKRAMGGVENYGGIAIVDGLIENIARLSATQNEIGWDKSEDKVKMRILSAYGVHPFILGEPLGVGGYAQAFQIEKRFCARQNIFLDMLSVLMTELLSANTEEKDLVVWWEKAVATDPQLDYSNWRFARTNGDISQNEWRAKLGLPPDEDDREAIISPAILTAVSPLLAAVATGGVSTDQLQALLEGCGVSEELAKKIAGEGPPPTEEGPPKPEPLEEATGMLQEAVEELKRVSKDVRIESVMKELTSEKFNPCSGEV